MVTSKLIRKLGAAALCATMAFGSLAGVSAAEEKHINAALFLFGTSIDPSVAYDGWITCRAGITETLVSIDENYEIQPILADSWEAVDENTWYFHIREGVKFHDGSDMDGEAVKASLERSLEVNERGAAASKIDTIEVDGMDMTITTTEPCGAFLSIISDPVYSIVKVGEDQDYENAPVATGPYKVTGYVPKDTIEVVKHDEYWNGAPDVDSITFKCIEDDSTRSLALQSGEMDVVHRVPSTDLPMFEADDNYQVFDAEGSRIRAIVFNYNREILTDSRIRKAFADAIDYDTILQIVGEGVSTLGAPVPSTDRYDNSSLEKLAYNPEEAQELLKEAGYEDTDGDGIVDKDGENLSLTISYSVNDYTSMLEAVQNMEKKIGLDIQLNLVDTLDEAKTTKNFDLICDNWVSLPQGDPQQFMINLYKTGGNSNVKYGDYSNAEYDELCEELTRTADLQKRAEIVSQMEQILLEDTASIWLMTEKNVVVSNNKVHNVTRYPINYYFVDNKMTID